ncbi:hypothetical protein TL16_g06107 [Triparma laevis f. inornata]|uniref:Uncharacterized protein n=1 Tax=Triparma laevis f. inornata TaxID=1714386 RepID=A0A9W7AJ03_9STRA|nr:hypothetical protein TL16_g06107 [Triparma laevis f. inornata]
MPPNQNIVTCLECDPQTEALQSLSSVSPTLSKEMDKVISKEYDRKLATLKSLHRTSSSTRSSSTSTLTALTSRTSLTLESVLLKISQNDSLYTRRLKNQNDSVSRRLRELIYECVGEFSKAHNRSLDRADYLSSRVVKSVKSKEQDLAWSIFGCRLEHEARNSVKVLDLTKKAIGDEQEKFGYSWAENLINEREDVRGMNKVAKVTRLLLINATKDRRTRRPGPSCNEISLPCTNPATLKAGLKGALTNTLKRSDSNPNTAIKPLPVSTLLSSKVVSWLVLTGLGLRGGRTALPMGSRIYFCLEERSKGGKGGGGSIEVKEAECFMDFLGSLYAGEDEPESGEATITAAKDRHKHVGEEGGENPSMRDTDGIFSYPSVLEGRGKGGGKLHFAAANLLNLAETRAAVDARSRGAVGEDRRGRGEGSIGTLYVPIEIFDLEDETTTEPESTGYSSDSSSSSPSSQPMEPLLKCKLVPLSKASVEELIRAYLFRDNSILTPSVSYVDLLPDSKDKFDTHFHSNYTVIYNPSPPPHTVAEYYSFDDDGAINNRHEPVDWTNAVACLVQYESVDGDVEELKADASVKRDTGGKKQKKKWDSAMLSHFCRWRACLAPATSNSTPKYLCDMHSKVKAFLDAGTTGEGNCPIADSNRFLPKKMPQNGNLTDLQLIKAASSLMVELENGKLSSTIRTFCKRAALESSEKYVHDLRNNGDNNSGDGQTKLNPEWGKWLQGERYKDATQKLSKELQVANQIYNIEKGVSGEVGRLKELGVYPTAELALIRRQFKILEREWEANGESNNADETNPGNDGNDDDASNPRQEAELELEFCERKRQLLRHRRMEVESDMVLVGGVTARETMQPKEAMFFQPGRGSPTKPDSQRERERERERERPPPATNVRQSTKVKRSSSMAEREAERNSAVMQHHPAHRTNKVDASPYLAGGGAQCTMRQSDQKEGGGSGNGNVSKPARRSKPNPYY